MRKFLFIFFLSVSISSYSQFTISGNIRNSETGETLPGANVLLQNSFLATVSSSDGSFIIRQIKGGNYLLKISYVRFETLEKQISLEKDLKLSIELSPKTYLSEEVIISAIRAGGGATTTYQMLTADEIEKRNTGRDLPYVMQILSSVVVNSDVGNGVGYTGLTIRGIDLIRINVTLNGMPVNDANTDFSDSFGI